MQIGLNTDIVHQGKTLHVQTEDVVAIPRYIVTHVFIAGSIIDSHRTECNEDQSEEELKEIIRAQHQRVIRAIYAGQYNRKLLLHRPRANAHRDIPLARHRANPPDESRPSPSNTLERPERSESSEELER